MIWKCLFLQIGFRVYWLLDGSKRNDQMMVIVNTELQLRIGQKVQVRYSQGIAVIAMPNRKRETCGAQGLLILNLKA